MTWCACRWRRWMVACVALAAAFGVAATEARAETGDRGGAEGAVERPQGEEALGAKRKRKKSSSDGDRKRKRKRKRPETETRSSDRESEPKRRQRRSREVTVPVDVGIGPSFFSFGNPLVDDALMSGPVFEDQPLHYGLRFGMSAVIDYDFVQDNPHMVPRKYRRMFDRDSVVHYSPAVLALIPRNLYISPKFDNTAVYGATWKLLGAGLTLMKAGSSRVSVGAGLLATYAFIDSDAFDSPTHFLRPGISLGAKYNAMLDDTFGVGVGWDSNLYIPQDIGGSVMSGSSDDALWHIGELFVTFHYRFPFTTEL